MHHMFGNFALLYGTRLSRQQYVTRRYEHTIGPSAEQSCHAGPAAIDLDRDFKLASLQSELISRLHLKEVAQHEALAGFAARLF